MTDAAQTFPLSFAQQRLWFLDRMAPGNPFYNIPVAIPIQASVDHRILQRVLNALVERHESLRTRFAVINDQPCQIICSPFEVELSVVDLRSLPATQREQRAGTLATEEARHSFDLEAGPLIRCKLLQCGLLDNILLLTLHHIVADGWSMGILARELSALYEAFRLRRSNPLPELSIQYVDFAVWQREWMRGKVLEEQLRYWKRKLTDVPVLNLASDRPRPSTLSFSGAMHAVQVPRSLSNDVRAAARHLNATPFMVLLAAFAALLHRYSAQDIVVVGAPQAGRSRSEIEPIVGFFVNSLVLCVDAGGAPSFAELVDRVRETALEAYAHQELPFEKLVEELHPARDPSRNPLFQVTFQLVNAPTLEFGVGRATGTKVEALHQSAIFDIAFTLLDAPDGFRGVIEYSTDLFDSKTIHAMDERFQCLLDGAMRSPETAISRLPLMSRKDSAAALAGGFGPKIPISTPFVLDAIADRADTHPDRVAVQAGPLSLSYRRLKQDWYKLSRRLAALGVTSETIIGVCLDPTIDTVIALLGVMDAGGVYLPLDPSYPRDRLDFMICDAGAAFIITNARHAGPGGVLERCEATLVFIEALSDTDAELDYHPTRPAGPDSLAYVIYTSGSTGRPKGVAISNIALSNHMQWMLTTFPLGIDDCVLQRTPCSFDAAMWEFLAPLMCGGRLVVLPASARKDPSEIVSTIISAGVTVLQVVPTLLRLLLDEPAFYVAKTLKRIFCGGEGLTEDIRSRVVGTLQSDLINLYGPTEATIDATAFVCTEQPAPFGVPIGLPVANMQAHVLDCNMEPVATGLDGELYLGGVGLARGYLGQPGLTAERFVPDPTSDRPGARLYPTGDQVRKLHDGNLLFLGRSDHQIKLRGYRIELAEVEAAIRRVAGVQDCAVMTDAGQTAMTAFIAPRPFSDSVDDQADDLARSQVDQWEKLYGQVYAGEGLEQWVSFNLVGWNSSYTGQPLAPEDMLEWRDETVVRIRALRPARVLEIGCGAGLLLTELAPNCTRYVGTDFSAAVLRMIETQLSLHGREFSNVELLHRRADNFTGMQPGDFDTIILNSVIQYFPNLAYLEQVLGQCIEIIADGGSIFIGDVRSLQLLDAFHLSIVRQTAAPELSGAETLQQVQAAVSQEHELILDPQFFHQFAAGADRVCDVEVMLKRGLRQNELVRFRYDVVLSIGKKIAQTDGASCLSLEWSRDLLSFQRLEERLLTGRPERVVVRNIPNVRVELEIALLQQLSTQPATTKDDDLYHSEDLDNKAPDPNRFWELAERIGYHARVTFSAPPHSHCFDALLWRPGVAPPSEPLADSPAPTIIANNPLRAAIARKMVSQIRESIGQILPDYMIPSAFVFSDPLPLLPNGKLDRKVLRAKTVQRLATKRSYAGARRPIEEALMAIWSEVTGVERIGIYDDFFLELGGHSLLAIQLISRIRDILRVDVSLKEIFTAPTVATFARALEPDSASKAAALERRAGLFLKLSRMSPQDLYRALNEQDAYHA
jgi:amino acid adenylation domain-containing protein